MSEFVDDLCWDIEPEKETVVNEVDTRIVSPRIRAVIEGHEVAVLIDSGSEVTVVSEKFYNELKNEYKIVELPVSNLNVSVAVGSKNIAIKRQVQLTLNIGNNKLTSPFLVVPGLATDVLVGIDWLSRFRCIIDVENQRIRVRGEELPDSIVTFRMAREKKVACRLLQVNDFLSVDVNEAWYQLDVQRKNIRENISNLGDVSVECSLGDSANDKQYVRQMSMSNTDLFVKEVDEYLKKLSSLDESCKSRVKKLLLKYETVFSTRPGYANVYQHTITLTKEKKIVRKSYPVALSQRESVTKKINELLTLNILERSNSEYCNPLRIVMKKDGTIRLCLDARFINVCILADNECPPRMEEILQKFEGAKFLSTTDLVLGYWQIPLDPESRKYTAFLHEGHLYQFTRIPFGLKTAGSGFIRALNLALGQKLSEVISCYVDDILIASRSFDEHIEHLSRLFEKLIAA